MFKKLLLITGVIVVGTLVYGSWYLSPVLSAGSGFAAKNICSGHFLSGMSGESIVEDVLTTAAPMLSNVSFDIDETIQLVDTRILGLFQRRAVYSAGTGCTLLAAGQKQLNRKLETAPTNQPDGELRWPQGTAVAPPNRDLEEVLEQAFRETDPQRVRNTKAVVVIHKGQLVAEKYAPGIGAGTPLIGWSMTKSITNLLIGLLVHDGRLTLDQAAPVPQWHENADDPRSAITIDQLLRMSSGLVFSEEYSLHSDVTRMLSVEPDAAGFAASKPLLSAPDSLWSYSSGTSNILSGIIRRTVGGDFQSYINFTRQGLFLPLGIHSAVLETDNNGTFIGSSYSYASGRDWARLGQFCLQEGQWQGKQLLPDNWLNYSTAPTPNNPRNNYGAHFWLNADPENGHGKRTWPDLPADVFSMSGFQGQRMVIVPSKDLVVVRLGITGGSNSGVETLVAGLIDVLDGSR